MGKRIYQTTRAGDPYDLEGGPKKWQWREPTGYVFFEAWDRVASNHALTGTHLRVLLGLVARCDWSNRCRCTYASLGRSLGLARQNVTLAMKGLVAARLVVCERQSGDKSYAVTLSPHLCWKGRPWHLAKAREQFQAQWRLVHGAAAARQGSAREASRGVDGTRRTGKNPLILHQALGILSSLP